MELKFGLDVLRFFFLVEIILFVVDMDCIGEVCFEEDRLVVDRVFIGGNGDFFFEDLVFKGGFMCVFFEFKGVKFLFCFFGRVG